MIDLMIRNHQNDFNPSRGCVDDLFIVQQWNRKENNKRRKSSYKLYWSRENVWLSNWILQSYNIDNRFVGIIKELFVDNRLYMKWRKAILYALWKVYDRAVDCLHCSIYSLYVERMIWEFPFMNSIFILWVLRMVKWCYTERRYGIYAETIRRTLS